MYWLSHFGTFHHIKCWIFLIDNFSTNSLESFIIVEWKIWQLLAAASEILIFLKRFHLNCVHHRILSTNSTVRTTSKTPLYSWAITKQYLKSLGDVLSLTWHIYIVSAKIPVGTRGCHWKPRAGDFHQLLWVWSSPTTFIGK